MAVESRLGRHVGIAMGLAKAFERACAAGYDAAQIFPGNPTGWRHVPLAPEAAARLREQAGSLDLAPLVIHAPYIINMATPEPELAAKSAQGLINALDRAGEIGVSYVVVHAGSHKGTGEEQGIARMARALEPVVAATPRGVELLIENSAGAGNILAGSPAALGRLLAALPPSVGACVDTAHLWGGGDSIADADAVERTLERLDTAIGLDRLRVLHFNDSAVDLESHRDVHAHLGEGRIGLEGLAAWAGHSALRGKPIIMETPEEEEPTREAARCAIGRLLIAGEVAEAAACVAALALSPCETNAE